MPPGYNPFAYPGEVDESSKGKGNGKLVAAVIIIVLLLAGAGAVMLLPSSSKKGNNQTGQSTTTNTNAASNAGDDVVPRSDGTLDLSKHISANSTLTRYDVADAHLDHRLRHGHQLALQTKKLAEIDLSTR